MTIITNINNQILLTQQYWRSFKKVLYGFPGGYIKKNETPHQAIMRKVNESTSLTVKKLEKILTYVKNTFVVEITYYMQNMIKKIIIRFNQNLMGLKTFYGYR